VKGDFFSILLDLAPLSEFFLYFFSQTHPIYLSRIGQGHLLDAIYITEKYRATCPILFFSIRRSLCLQVESPSSSDKVYRH